jgi:hypothetical protein
MKPRTRLAAMTAELGAVAKAESTVAARTVAGGTGGGGDYNSCEAHECHTRG